MSMMSQISLISHENATLEMVKMTKVGQVAVEVEEEQLQIKPYAMVPEYTPHGADLRQRKWVKSV